MELRRIAAIAGLVLIVISVLCVISVGFLPAYQELLMTTSTITFIGAAAVLGVLVYRRKAEEEAAGDEAGEPQDKTEK